MGKKFKWKLIKWAAPVLIPAILVGLLLLCLVIAVAAQNDQLSSTLQNENQESNLWEDNDLDEGDYRGAILTDGQIPVVYYAQYDPRWKDIAYGTGGTIGRSGCDPTSMSIVISSLEGIDADPVFMKLWSEQHGYRVEGGGQLPVADPKIGTGIRPDGGGMPGQ